MFNMFKRRESTESDIKLQKVIDLLFPQFETRITESGSKYAIDSSIDSNIDAVVTDLKDGYLDSICINTLEACAQKLARVREILNPGQTLRPDIEKYILSVDKYQLDFDQYNPTEAE